MGEFGIQVMKLVVITLPFVLLFKSNFYFKRFKITYQCSYMSNFDTHKYSPSPINFSLLL